MTFWAIASCESIATNLGLMRLNIRRGPSVSIRFAVSALLVAVLLAGCSERNGETAAPEVNLYSARHYDSDLPLYERFTQETGIKINRIEGNADQLIARMKSEGANSPADLFITADAGALWRAQQAGRSEEHTSELPSLMRISYAVFCLKKK